ncbi:hypothetical protein [Enterobacter asburiae]|uniref:hypothetical protein n=1 Tax=Enterobacter asburiae TaxID=61645 RepID=UPI003753F352
MNIDIITNKNGKGIFDRKAWIDESNDLFMSAKILRYESTRNRTLLEENTGRCDNIWQYADVVTSTQKTSRLLLGYAFEMLLKSAVLLMNLGASKKTLESIFHSYSHKLDSMAKDLILDLTSKDFALLKMASDDIRFNARYPVGIVNDEDYINKINERRRGLGDDSIFDDMICLYEKIKSIVVRFDRDVNKCADFNVFRGRYFTLFMRSGGGLKSRSIVCFSAVVSAENKNKKYVKKSLESECNRLSVFYTYFWDTFDFFEDTGKVLRELPDE